MDHMDELRRRDQLLSWGEQGLLTPTQLKRALAPATSAASAAQWRWALDRLLGFYGCLLLALGVIFFFAFNWDELHRGHKLAAAALALSGFAVAARSEEHTSELQSRPHLVCRLLLEKKKTPTLTRRAHV